MKQPHSRSLAGLLLIAITASACASTATVVTPTAAPPTTIATLPPATATVVVPTQAPTQTQLTPTIAVSATPAGLGGCVPACVSGYSVPGDLPVGVYQTQYFFGHRMQVTLTGEWTSTEDSTGELGLAPKATPEDAVKFWEDVYATDHGVRVSDVPITAEGLYQWLSTNRNFKTTAPVSGTIGSDIPAIVFDVSIAPGASNPGPNCPAPTCFDFLSFPQWSDSWGIAGNQVQRFYLANVSYGGEKHLFVAVIYPDKPENMPRLRALAEPVIASVRVPVDPQ